MTYNYDGMSLSKSVERSTFIMHRIRGRASYCLVNRFRGASSSRNA
jgi:hypothetical protein